MVIENRTGYPVRVRAVEDHVQRGPTGSTELIVIQSGRIDTVPPPPKGRATLVVFDVDRPTTPSGAPVRTDGLTIRCVSRGRSL